MTDNEIMQALECCGTDMNCHRCPAKEDENGCIRKTCQNALDLINRLQADKEALIAGQETLQKLLASKEAEIKNLKNACFCIANERDAIGDCMSEAVEEAKAEAIKEFAERLKPMLGFGRYTSYEDIDNLVKEMVGDAE